MSETIGSLFFNFGASTKKLDSAFAKIEQQENKLEALRISNAEKLEDINDKLANKKYQYELTEQQLATAKSKRDLRSVEKYKAELKKLDVQLEELDLQRIRSTERAKRAEELLTKQIAKQQKEYTKLTARVQRLRKSLGGLKGVFASVFTIGAFKNLIDHLDAIGKRARDIGMTASQLQELDNQAKLAGMSSEQLDTAVREFNRNISLANSNTGSAVKSLQAMGISLQDANGKTKTQSELLKETATYFANTAGQAENAGYATKIFGERGASMLRIFEQGEGVIDKVFNAKGIDEATASAERFKDNWQVFQNYAMKAGGMVLEGWTKIFDLFKDISGEGLGMSEYRRQEAKANEEQKKRNIELLKQRERFYSAQEAYNKLLEKPLSTESKFLKLAREIADLQNTMLDDNDFATASAIQEEINSKLKEQLKLKTELEKKSESRKEFELQTKIDVLKSQGRTKEAEALEFARKRNELMDKYGYSIEQATKAQKTLDALQNGGGVEYSDKMKKKAEAILKRGKGGTIGDKTIAEAQAIVDGKKLDGGFKTSIFSDANKQNKETFRNINVDAKTSKQQLDDEAKKLEKETANSTKSIDVEIKNLNKLIEEIKSAVQKLATENSNKEQTK